MSFIEHLSKKNCLIFLKHKKHLNFTVDCQWSDWEDWSDCSKECGGGTATRQRAILKEAIMTDEDCEGERFESRGCNEDSCGGICSICNISDKSI